MSLTAYQALDKAIEAGGTGLTGKAIAGTGPSAVRLLEEMCSADLLEKSPGRGSKYSITAKGRETWEQQTPEDRVRQRKRKEMIGFLAIIAKKADKALTEGERRSLSEAMRQDACDQKLVEPGTKANSYRLLPAGEDMILAEQPVEQQLERLRQQHRQIVAQWRAAQQKLGRELEGAGSHSLQVAVNQLAESGASACRAFDEAVAGLSNLTSVAQAARQVREEIEAASRQAQEAVEAEKSRLADLGARLRQQVGQQQEQLGAFERRVEERLKDVVARLKAAPPEVANAPPSQRKGSPSDAAVWQVLRPAYERLRQENLRMGGIVKVPELTDYVIRALPGLVPSAFLDLLQKWQQEDRVGLLVCNDPRLEPRAAEGIQSPRGLLFYVQMS